MALPMEMAMVVHAPHRALAAMEAAATAVVMVVVMAADAATNTLHAPKARAAPKDKARVVDPTGSAETMRNPAATKVVLQVVAMAMHHAPPGLHRVVSQTPCAPASI